MPKLKTCRGAVKRFKKTASGYKRRQSNKNHILQKKGHKSVKEICVVVYMLGASRYASG